MCVKDTQWLKVKIESEFENSLTQISHGTQGTNTITNNSDVEWLASIQELPVLENTIKILSQNVRVPSRRAIYRHSL